MLPMLVRNVLDTLQDLGVSGFSVFKMEGQVGVFVKT